MNKWTTYNKIFTIRNEYCEEAIKSAVDGINAEMKAAGGVCVRTETASFLPTITKIEFSEHIYLYSGREFMMAIDMDDFDEVEFDFLIEEELNTGKKLYHSCLIAGYTDEEDK